MTPPHGRAALAAAVARLRAAGIDGAARDARLLMAEAAGVDPARLSLVLDSPLLASARFQAMLARREAREPVAKILGRRAFYGRNFRITGDVLDPRPETELLVELALERPFGRVLDLGTGSGCLLVTLLAERPEAAGAGTDMSAAALAVAAANAAAHGVSGRAELLEGDWFAPVSGRFDLVVANPPYIALDEMADLAPEVVRWDPWPALTDGGDGLGAYRAIAAGAGAHLADGGRLIVECGWRQGGAVAAILRQGGLADVTVHPDLDGRQRAVSAIWRG